VNLYNDVVLKKLVDEFKWINMDTPADLICVNITHIFDTSEGSVWLLPVNGRNLILYMVWMNGFYACITFLFIVLP
jgi:hypothetical protein